MIFPIVGNFCSREGPIAKSVGACGKEQFSTSQLAFLPCHPSNDPDSCKDVSCGAICNVKIMNRSAKEHSTNIPLRHPMLSQR